MEKRIQLEMRGKNPDQIKELVLDSCCSTTFVGLTDDFVNLKSLSACAVGLTSLKGFPKLPNLKKLELSENRISGGLNILVNNSPNLVSLNLSANKIDKLEVIEVLKDLQKLKTLDLCQCDVSRLDNYKEKVFAALPSLKYLDGFDKDDKACHSEEENGAKAGKSMEDGDSELDEEDFDEEDEEEDLDGEIDEEGDEEGEADLSYLERDNIDEESEGEDYSPEEDDDEEVEEESEDDDDESTPRGQKRKLDDTQD